jgi:NDP-sugar pyrophosphorylase family protein
MSIKTEDLFEHIPPHLRRLFESCEYPWQIVARISEYINEMVKNGIEGYSHYLDGVLVGKGANISPSAHISPPAIIGDDCEIRVGAYIRGNVILGRGAVVGNSTELKNCILLDGAQAPHYNYVGDSLLGVRAHLGAGAIISNFKLDHKPIKIRSGDDVLETGLRKMGAILGDFAEIGCGSVIFPGSIVGRRTLVYPLTPLRGVIPSDSIIHEGGRITPRNIEE